MVIERFLPGRFMMRPLAENYIRRFQHDPYPYEPGSPDEARVKRIAAIGLPAQSRMKELAQVMAYNELVAQLDAGGAAEPASPPRVRRPATRRSAGSAGSAGKSPAPRVAAKRRRR